MHAIHPVIPSNARELLFAEEQVPRFARNDNIGGGR